MTPKEKAEKLVEKYYKELSSPIFNVHYGIPVKCALIAVEEIINASTIRLSENDSCKFVYIDTYWQEVKQHLNEMK